MMPAPATGSDLGYRNRKEPSSSSSYIPLPRATDLESTEGLSVNTDQQCTWRLALQSGRGLDHRCLHHRAPVALRLELEAKHQQLTEHTGGHPATQFLRPSSSSAHLSMREKTGNPVSGGAWLSWSMAWIFTWREQLPPPSSQVPSI